MECRKLCAGCNPANENRRMDATTCEPLGTDDAYLPFTILTEYGSSSTTTHQGSNDDQRWFGDSVPVSWLVKVALDRPYTFIVMALMILIFGPLAAIRTPTDIFPNIGIPVIGVEFGYTDVPIAEFKPDRLIAHMRELPAAVESLALHQNSI